MGSFAKNSIRNDKKLSTTSQDSGKSKSISSGCQRKWFEQNFNNYSVSSSHRKRRETYRLRRRNLAQTKVVGVGKGDFVVGTNRETQRSGSTESIVKNSQDFIAR